MTDEATVNELRPPPEHEGKPLHWVTRGDGADVETDIAEWSGERWARIGQDWLASPDDMAAAGWCYLGPAEWLGEPHGEWVYAQRLLRTTDHMLQASAARIAELEAEIARSNTADHYMHPSGYPAVHDADLNVTMILPLNWPGAVAESMAYEAGRCARFDNLPRECAAEHLHYAISWYAGWDEAATEAARNAALVASYRPSKMIAVAEVWRAHTKAAPDEGFGPFRPDTEILTALGDADVVAASAVGTLFTAEELRRVGWHGPNAEGAWTRCAPATKAAAFPARALRP